MSACTVDFRAQVIKSAPMRANLSHPVHVSTRVSQAIETRLDAVRARLGQTRAELLRYYLEEMPADYVPARFAKPATRKGGSNG